MRAALHEAELQLVGRVVADGGIGPWRAGVDRCLQTSLPTFARRGRLSRRVAARLILALADQPTGDRWWSMVEARADLDWGPLWLHLSRLALSPYRSEPLFLLAWSTWRGDIQQARAAAGDALRQDPGHRAAATLVAMLAHGVDASRPPSLTVGAVPSAGMP